MTVPPPLRILPLPDLGGIEVARSVDPRERHGLDDPAPCALCGNAGG